MFKQQSDFSKGSIASNIMNLALPLTLAQLVSLLYNIVDRIFIGRIGEQSSLALGGVGITFPIITIIIAFANLFGMGSAPLFSIARGQDDSKKAQDIMGNCFSLLIIFGLILTLVCLTFKKPLLFMFGASEETFKYANQYITIYLLGTIFVMLSLGMNGFINAQGFGKIGMLSVVIGAITNIVLDPIFMFAFSFGVQGAAIATVLSQAISSLWIIAFLKKNSIIKLHHSSFKLQKNIVIEIISLGMSGFIMATTNSLVSIVINSSLQSFGGDLYVASMTIINSIREIVTMPISGITSAAQPVMGYNYGAKLNKRVLSAIKFSTIICVIYTTILWLLIALVPNFFIHIFNNDPQLVEITQSALKLYFMGFFMQSFQLAGQSVAVALGKSKQAIFFSLFRKVIIVVPLTLILPHLFNLGIDGIFIAEPISNFIDGGACYITMWLTIGKNLKKKST